MSDERKRQIARKIEVAANVAIIIVAAAVVLLFVRNYMMGRAGSRPTVSIGTKFALKQVDWQSSDKSIVLAISTQCHFCNESAGFYRTLVEQCKQQHIRTIAVLPQSAGEARSYLQNEGVTVDEVRQAALSDLEVSGTPTLVLVDKGGIVRSVWVGKLPGEKEKEVLAKLAS